VATFNRNRNGLTLGIQPLAYMGSADDYASAQVFWVDRAPTPRDYYGYLIGDLWIDQSTYVADVADPEVWMLVLNENKTALWIKFYGGAGALETLTADTGTNPVPPDATDTIFVKGTAPIVTRGVSANNQLFVETDGTLATTYTTDAGNAAPAAGVLNVLGGAFINTAGAGNTVTINLDTDVISTITTDNGIATPVNNNINFTDGENTNTNAVGDDMWVNLNRVIRWPNTSAAGDEGVIYLDATCDGQECTGGTRFMHNYGTDNTFLGSESGNLTSTGDGCNVFIGTSSGVDVTTAAYTVGVGANCLNSLVDANYTTAVGYNALGNFQGTGSDQNVAIGANALASLQTISNGNVAVGTGSLFSHIGGGVAFGNTAVGNESMYFSQTCHFCVAVGEYSLRNATDSEGTVAVGFRAGNYIQGDDNTAVGMFALGDSTGSSDTFNNTAVGYRSLAFLEDGSSLNCGLGMNSGGRLLTGIQNVFLGYRTGFNYIGAESYNLTIYNSGTSGESNTIRIGTHGAGAAQQNRCFVAGIRGITTGVADAIPVLIDSSHQLGTVSSSIRYKENVENIESEESERIYDLRPVTFNYKSDETKSKQYGLIAEEVEWVLKRLVVYDPESREPQTVKYMDLIPLLLNEVINLNKRIKALEEKS